MPSFRQQFLGDWLAQAGSREDFDKKNAFAPITRHCERGILSPLPGPGDVPPQPVNEWPSHSFGCAPGMPAHAHPED
jgi:hypothetical protein